MKVLSFILQRSFARYVALDLASAAQELGWSTHWIDIEGRLLRLSHATDAERAAGMASIIDEARAGEPHVAFSYGLEFLAPLFHPLVPGDRRSLARLIDRPAVYFLFDFGFPFDRPIDATTLPIIEALQGPDSLVLCWDREAVDVARAYGILHAAHFPMAVNQRVFVPDAAGAAERDIPIVFAGGPSPERRAALHAVADLGLQVYGYDPEGWAADEALRAAYHPALLDRRDMAATYGRARLAINVTRPHGPSSLNMRVYEAMASGCLLLTDERADVHALFVEGEHLLVYRSPSDLRRQAIRYLNDEPERGRLAAAGRERVLAAHTYDVRLKGVQARVEQFVKAALLCRKLREYEERDAEKARSFTAFVDDRHSVALHPDHVAVVRARCSSRLDDQAGARRAIDAAFAANPRSLAALRVALEIGEHAAVPDGLRDAVRVLRAAGPAGVTR